MAGAREFTAEETVAGGELPASATRRPLSRQTLLRFLTLFVAYFATASAGLAWATTSGAASPVWPAAGVALGGLAILGRAYWPAIALGLLAAMQLTGATHGLLSHLMIALGNSAAAVLGATVLHRISGMPAPPLSRLPHAMGLLCGGVAAAAISAVVGIVALWFDGALPWAAATEVLPTWFFGDAVGAFIIAGLILSWRSCAWKQWSRLDWLHLLLVLAAAAGAGWGVFYGDQSARAFLVYPVLVWAALIHYTPGATAALMVTAVIAIAGTSMGTGPFGAADAAGDLVLLQQFLGVSSLTVLLLAAVGDERQTETRARMEAAEALAASRLEELNSLYESAPIGLAFFSRDYRYLRVNGELAAINGVAADDHIGRTIRDVLSDQAPSVEPIIDRIFETGEAIRDLEVSGETPQQPGKIRHWLAGFYPVPGTRGGIDAVGAWVIEISERKAAEEREILLAREVDHRAKNLLAVVQSIVQLTPGDDGPTVKASLIGRILALGRAHSLLSDARWDGVDLGRLVHEELAPFASADGAISAQGPSVTLRPAAAQSIGLVLHELATNAAKYGALSRPDGSLLVEWDYADGDKGRLVEIVWTESGGPSPKEPSGTGFGSNIIRASVERQLRGQVTREWRPDGLRCTLRIPIAELLGAAEG